MPNYFFHLRERATFLADDEGLFLPNLQAAQAQAVREARELASADAKAGRLCLMCSVEVTDTTGRLVFSVPFRDVLEVEQD